MAIVEIPKRLCRRAPTWLYLTLMIMHACLAVFLIIKGDSRHAVDNIVFAIWAYMTYEVGVRLNRIIDIIFANSEEVDMAQKKKIDDLMGR